MRSDLDGRLPIVYNGRTAEEWYTLYCQEALRYSKLFDAAKSVVKAINEADATEGCGDRVVSEDLAIAELESLVAR